MAKEKTAEQILRLKKDLEKKLIVGAKIRIGKEYAKKYGYKAGRVITLIEGVFEYDNGLYVQDQYCPAIFNKAENDFDSIYHLFGNDLDLMMDCEILHYKC